MWMSDTPRRAASAMMPLIRRMAGASASLASRSPAVGGSGAQGGGGRVVLAVGQVLGGGKIGGEACKIITETERARRVGRGLPVHSIGFGEDAVESRRGRRVDPLGAATGAEGPAQRVGGRGLPRR